MLKCKRYAYKHKKDPDQFGVLNAVDYDDARRHLGSSFRIKTVLLSSEEEHDQMFDRDMKKKIVDRVIK